MPKDRGKNLVGIKLDELIKMSIGDKLSNNNEKIIEIENKLNEFEKLKKSYDFLDKSESDLFKLGLEFDEKEDYPMASFYYILTLKKNPKNIKALINLGIMYYEFNMEKRAIEIFEKALEIEPDNDIAKENLNIIKGDKNDNRN